MAEFVLTEKVSHLQIFTHTLINSGFSHGMISRLQLDEDVLNF